MLMMAITEMGKFLAVRCSVFLIYSPDSINVYGSSSGESDGRVSAGGRMYRLATDTHTDRRQYCANSQSSAKNTLKTVTLH